MAIAPAGPATTVPSFPPVREASAEEGAAMLDRRARCYLGISGEEFLRRWTCGDYAADPDAPGVMEVAAMLLFAQAPPTNVQDAPISTQQ